MIYPANSVQTEKIKVVYLTTNSCQTCAKWESAFQALSQSFGEAIAIIPINIDDPIYQEKNAAGEYTVQDPFETYQVNSVPSIILYGKTLPDGTRNIVRYDPADSTPVKEVVASIQKMMNGETVEQPRNVNRLLLFIIFLLLLGLFLFILLNKKQRKTVKALWNNSSATSKSVTKKSKS